MKKWSTLVAMLSFGFGMAQDKTENPEFGFSKGAIIIEGQISFGTEKGTSIDEGTDTEEGKRSSYLFAPSVGHFISDKFVVGVGLELTQMKQTQTEFAEIAGNPDDVEETKMTSFGAKIFARYYFLKLGKRFQTYTEFSANYTSGKIVEKETGFDDDKSTLKLYGAGIDLGINYFVSPKIAISFGLADVLQYSHLTGKDDVDGGEFKTSSFNGNLNVFKNFFSTPTFGLLYKL